MSLPRMSLHIGDYKKDTGHLRAAGHGAYFLLILHYWATGGLPHDDKQLAAIACMTDREWKLHKPTMVAFFKEGPWKHGRIEKEIADAEEKYRKRAAAGREGGSAPRKPKQKGSNAPAKPEQPITLTDKELDGGGDARATPPLISPEAFTLADRLCEAAGWHLDEPQSHGTPLVAQKWLSGNWNADLCVETVRRVRAIARKPINTLAYFERPIAEAHAEQAKPLPVVVVDQNPEVTHAKAKPGGNIVGAVDRLAAAGITFGERPRLSDGTGETVVRLLPKGAGG
jgi:uncharacterized protein YdaU (DUF1376 family)